MNKHGHDDHTHTGFLHVRDNLSLVADQVLLAESAAESPPAPPCCINCGYKQLGQIIDRCPECGLLWASRLCDPTPWAIEGPNLQSWWATASSVWSWNRRTRIRTALVPSTPQSRQFANRSIFMATPVLALALALSNTESTGSLPIQVVSFLMNLLFGSLLLVVCSTAMLSILRLAIRGTWRRRFSFVPACIDYACVWWLPTAALLLILASLHLISPDAGMSAFVPAVAVGGALAWMIWLWESVSESGQVPYAGIRIIAVTLVCSWASSILLSLLPGSVQSSIAQVLARGNPVRTNPPPPLGTLGPAPVSALPRTYALLVDHVNTADDYRVKQAVAAMGAAHDTTIVLRGPEANLQQIRNSFKAMLDQIGPQDSFILYMNGHGARNGAGAVQFEDGEINTRQLRSILSNLNSATALVMIDSSCGDKFIHQLRGSGDLVVLASTDNRDAFGLCAFWDAISRPESDRDGDGFITVKEAYWAGSGKMLEAGAIASPNWLTMPPNEQIGGLTIAGDAIARLEVMGSASDEDFAVPTPRRPKP